jgi:hypothetical protein
MKQAVDVQAISVAFREVLAHRPIVNGFELATARYDENWDWHLDCGGCDVDAGDWQVYVGALSGKAEAVWFFANISSLSRVPGSENLPTESGFVECRFKLEKNGKTVGIFEGCTMPRIEVRI